MYETLILGLDYEQDSRELITEQKETANATFDPIRGRILEEQLED